MFYKTKFCIIKKWREKNMKRFFKFLVIGLSMTLLTACVNNGSKGNHGYDGEGDGGGGDGGGDPIVTVNVISQTIENIALNSGWENATQYPSFQLDTAITVSSAGGSNTGKYYESNNSYRVYGSENGTITLSAAEGRELKYVIFTYSKKEGTEINGLTSGTKKELSGSKAEFSLSQNKGQVQITEIEVGYTGQKGEDPYAREGWNKDELDILAEYYYGVEIPFIYFPGIALKDSALYGTYVEVPSATLEDCQTYIAAFTENEAWEDVDLADEGNDAYFMTTIETKDGLRYVEVNIYVIDDEGELLVSEEGVGTLYIDITDPYYYAWDEELMGQILSALGSQATIPALDNITKYTFTYDSEEFTYFAFIFYDQDLDALNAYHDKFSDWVAEDVQKIVFEELDNYEYYSFTARPASDDLDLTVEYYPAIGAISLLLEKSLPKLDEFPMDTLKEFNGGIEVIAPEGAIYFTCEEDDGLLVVKAYGIDATELATYEGLLADAYQVEEYMDEDDDGNPVQTGSYVVTAIQEDGAFYYFLYEYDADEEVLTLSFNGPASYYEPDTWAKVSALYDTFKTAKQLTAALPDLSIEGLTKYLVEITLDDPTGYYYDSFMIAVEGDHVNDWLKVLGDLDYVVPSTPSQWGYECVDPTSDIEIDVEYDDEAQLTYATVYRYLDLFD